MLYSSVRECRDPDEFWHAARRPAVMEMHVTGRGQFFLRATKIDLQDLWFHSRSEILPRSQRIETDGRVGIGFQVSGNALMKHQGGQLASDEVSVLAPGGSLWNGTQEEGTFCAISLPQGRLLELGIALTGRDVLPKEPVMTAKVKPTAFKRLLALHDKAVSLAASAPHLLTDHSAARGLEAAWEEAFVGCLIPDFIKPDKAASRRSARIIRRLRELEEANRDRSLYVTDACAALRVSQRTLHHICTAVLGMGPKQYLLLRRLQLVHQELRKAKPEWTTVTEVATQYGFWELGRLAVAYKARFGQSPSATLRTNYDETSDERPSRSWASLQLS